MSEVWWSRLVSDPRASGMPDQRWTDAQLADLAEALDILGFPAALHEALDLPRKESEADDWVTRYVASASGPPEDRTESQLVLDAYSIANRLAMYDAADSIRCRFPKTFGDPRP